MVLKISSCQQHVIQLLINRVIPQQNYLQSRTDRRKKKHIFVRRCNVMHERRLKKKNNMIKENIPSLEEMYNSKTVGTGKITYEFNKPTMS